MVEVLPGICSLVDQNDYPGAPLVLAALLDPDRNLSSLSPTIHELLRCLHGPGYYATCPTPCRLALGQVAYDEHQHPFVRLTPLNGTTDNIVPVAR